MKNFGIRLGGIGLILSVIWLIVTISNMHFTPSYHAPQNTYTTYHSETTPETKATKKSKSSKSYSSSYTSNSMDYDPVDYDDPDEYADDAVGHDFDDWDSAYDYWENY